MRKILFALSCFILFSTLCFSQKKVIAVIGSSTAAGYDASPMADSAWVNRFKHYLQGLGEIDTIYNLAHAGDYSYYGMPTGSVPMDGNHPFQPDPDKNVNMALSFNPDIVLISYPTNDYTIDVSLTDFLANLRTIYKAVTDAGTVAYIATTQPRDFDQTGADWLLAGRD